MGGCRQQSSELGQSPGAGGGGEQWAGRRQSSQLGEPPRAPVAGVSSGPAIDRTGQPAGAGGSGGEQWGQRWPNGGQRPNGPNQPGQNGLVNRNNFGDRTNVFANNSNIGNRTQHRQINTNINTGNQGVNVNNSTTNNINNVSGNRNWNGGGGNWQNNNWHGPQLLGQSLLELAPRQLEQLELSSGGLVRCRSGHRLARLGADAYAYSNPFYVAPTAVAYNAAVPAGELQLPRLFAADRRAAAAGLEQLRR